MLHSALYVDAAHGAAALDCVRKCAEAAVLHYIAYVYEFKAKTGIGLVRAVTVHGFLPGYARQRKLNVYIQSFLHQALDEALLNVHYVVLLHEGHLKVDLRELGLTVCAQVLVAVTAGYLHIAVKAGKHQKLLEYLGALGQGVELAGLYAAGYQIVAGALGGALAEGRSLYLYETLLCEVLVGYPGYLAAHEKVGLHTGAAQIQIAILKAELLGGIHVIIDVEGRSLGYAQYLQLLGNKLQLAGLHVSVYHLLIAPCQYALYGDDILAADGFSLFKHFLRKLALVKGHLHGAGAVAEAYEYEGAQVPPCSGPAHEHHFLAYLVHSRLCAVVCAFPTLKQFCHCTFPLLS